MKYSHRFFLWAPIALLVALLAAAVIHWFTVANSVSKFLDAANGHQIAPGVTLHYAHRQLAGFPFRIDIELDNMKIDVAATHGPVEWRAERFAMHMLDYGRFQAVYEAAGKQTVSWTNSKGVHRVLQFTPGLLRASSISAHGRLSRFDMEMIAASSPDLQIANLQFHLRRAPDANALDIVLSLDDAHPPQPSALGKSIARIRFNARLTPADSWTGLLSGGNDWRASAENWRTHQGALDIANLDIAWGKMDVSGAGTLMLDDMQRPRGLLKLHVSGMQYLAAEHPGKGFFNDLLKAIVQFPSDGAGRLPVPLAFKDGIAFAYQTPAATLDPLY